MGCHSRRWCVGIAVTAFVVLSAFVPLTTVVGQAKNDLKDATSSRKRDTTAPLLCETLILRTHVVSGRDAEAVAKTLNQLYANDTSVRVSALRSNELLVLASAAVHAEIARHFPPATVIVAELIPMNLPDGEQVTKILKSMFGDAKSGAPFLEYLTQRSSLLVRGSREQIAEVKDALKPLVSPPTPTLRIFTVEQGGASDLAEAISKIIGQMKANPVKVIVPGKVEPEPSKKVEPPKTDVRPTKGAEPLTLTAVGNKLIATSQDPEALTLVMVLVRLYTTGTCEQSDIHVIRLKHAQAVNVARVLDELFNEPRSQRGPTPPVPRAPERIRVVADSASNSLFLKANPLDTVTIERLISTVLDLTDIKAPRQ